MIQLWGGPRDGEFIAWERDELLVPIAPDMAAMMVDTIDVLTPMPIPVNHVYQRGVLISPGGHRKNIMVYRGESKH